MRLFLIVQKNAQQKGAVVPNLGKIKGKKVAKNPNSAEPKEKSRTKTAKPLVPF